MSADKETKEITFSTGRKAVIEELNGLEQVQADKTSDSTNSIAIGYYRAAASLVSLDGEKFGKSFDLVSLNLRLQRLKARESDELAKFYFDSFTNLTTEELGNESTVGDSQPNS